MTQTAAEKREAKKAETGAAIAEALVALSGSAVVEQAPEVVAPAADIAESASEKYARLIAEGYTNLTLTITTNNDGSIAGVEPIGRPTPQTGN